MRLHSDRGYIDRQHQGPWDKLVGKEKREMHKKGFGRIYFRNSQGKNYKHFTLQKV